MLLVSSIALVFFFVFLMSQAPLIGSSGGLLLAWRLGVELEYFLVNTNTISAWCYSDPP
jgi:hypothetical protein